MIAEVYPLRRLRRDLDVFDYEVPNSLEPNLQPGQLVQVSFRRGRADALVTKLKSSSQVPKERLQQIEALRTDSPIVANHQLKLISWAADKYFISPSALINSFLPAPPRRQMTTKAALSSYLVSHKAQDLTLPKSQLGTLKNILAELKASSKPALFQWSTSAQRYTVYLKLIERQLNEVKQVALIFPTFHEIRRFLSYLPDRYQRQVALFHSELNATQLWQQWQAVLSGEAKIIIGTRAAIWSPWYKLGAIIVDREEAADHKQYDQNPRYRVHEVAEWLAAELNCQLIFSSAAPRLTTWHKTQTSDYTALPLFEGAKALNLSLIDTRGQARAISSQLEEAITQTLEQEQQVILFLNRRGAATSLQCRDCGHLYLCPECQLPLTVHQQELVCHHCQYRRVMPLSCAECQGQQLVPTGQGTERLANLLTKLFPTAIIERLDKDQSIISDKLRQADIIVGTQYLTTHYQPRQRQVGLLGVASADTPLFVPDVRAAELTWQLLNELRLYAYDHKIPRLIVQSSFPKHHVWQPWLDDRLANFLNEELKTRHDLRYPPFVQLIKLIHQHKDEKKALNEAEAIAKVLKDLSLENVEILGPVPSHPIKIRGRWRWHIVLKLSSSIPASLAKLLRELPSDWLIDVEPESLL